MARKHKSALKSRLKSVTTIKQYTLSSNFDEAKRFIESKDNDAFISYLNNYRIDINDLGEVGLFPIYLLNTFCSR